MPPDPPTRPGAHSCATLRCVTAKDDLAKALGASPPDSVGALPPATLSRLAEQIEAAKERQDAEMRSSVQVAIDGVPFAVRGIVRKALLG